MPLVQGKFMSGEYPMRASLRWVSVAGAWALTCGASQAADGPAAADAQATAHAQAVQAQAAAAKAGYDAQTSKYQSEEERIKAAQAAVPSSGLSNTANAGAGAGTAETNYLAADLISRMADKIVRESYLKLGCELPATAEQPKFVVIFAGMAAPDLSDWATFDQRLRAVEARMNNALNTRPPKELQGQNYFLGPALALAPALLSFLNSADSVQGVTASTDDATLVTDVAHGLLEKKCHVKIATQITNANAGVILSARLRGLADERDKLESAIKTGKVKDPASDLKIAAAEYDKLMADIYGSPAAADGGKAVAGTLSLPTILKEYGVADAMGSGKAIFLKVQNAAGGLFTRKNIATFCTAEPFSVSASVVVSYAAMDGTTEETLAAGTFESISPYQDVSDVKTSDVAPSASGGR